MSIFHRISFNIFSFFVGTFLFGLLVLVFSQYGNLTASVSDAFSDTTVSYSDIDVYSTISGLSIKTNRAFNALNSQSIRISFLYNPIIDTSAWSLASDYPHSISLQDGEWTIILTLDNKKIGDDILLAQLFSPISEVTDQVILQSIVRYDNIDTQNLQFHVFSLNHINKNT